MMFFFIVYVYVALKIWRRRAAPRRWNTQPYADFFSDDGSALNNPETGHDRWTGEDIEILEEEFDDAENWEPLNNAEQNSPNGQRSEMKG